MDRDMVILFALILGVFFVLGLMSLGEAYVHGNQMIIKFEKCLELTKDPKACQEVR